MSCRGRERAERGKETGSEGRGLKYKLVVGNNLTASLPLLVATENSPQRVRERERRRREREEGGERERRERRKRGERREGFALKRGKLLLSSSE